MRRFWISVAVLALVTGGCKQEGPTGPGENGTGQGTGNLRIEAVVTPQGAFVELYDSTGQGITGATVIINGQTLTSTPLTPGVYMDTTIHYQKGETYELQVNAPGYGSASATVRAPQIDSLKITQPPRGAQLPPGDPIQVVWTYYGGQNDGLVGVNFSYENTDSLEYESDTLPGSTTQHTIPGSHTTRNGNATISVSAGKITAISGLLTPSYFAVGTYDEVEVVIGQGGGGGGTGTWSGTLQGTINGQTVTGTWYYANGYFGGTLSGGVSTYFGGQISSWPPQNATVFTQTGLTLSFTGAVQGNQVSGTWEVTAGGTGSGTWEGTQQ